MQQVVKFSQSCSLLVFAMNPGQLLRLEGIRVDVSFFAHKFQSVNELNDCVQHMCRLFDNIVTDNPEDKNRVEGLKQDIVQRIVQRTLDINPCWLFVLRQMDPVKKYLADIK